MRANSEAELLTEAFDGYFMTRAIVDSMHIYYGKHSSSTLSLTAKSLFKTQRRYNRAIEVTHDFVNMPHCHFHRD